MKLTLISYLLAFSMQAVSMTGLKIGANAPDLEVQTTVGDKINFSKLDKNTVLVFYRGAWCPYCIKQLDSIQKDLVKKLDTKNQLIAISVDRTAIAKKMKAKQKYDFIVVSDTKAKSLQAFNIVNKLDDKLVAKYKAAYKIDVEGDSGETHHMVAHPAVYVIKNGKVTFADIQIDYKKRTNNNDILKALN